MNLVHHWQFGLSEINCSKNRLTCLSLTKVLGSRIRSKVFKLSDPLSFVGGTHQWIELSCRWVSLQPTGHTCLRNTSVSDWGNSSMRQLGSKGQSSRILSRDKSWLNLMMLHVIGFETIRNIHLYLTGGSLASYFPGRCYLFVFFWDKFAALGTPQSHPGGKELNSD